METVNGCTVIASESSVEPTRFGPAETAGAYVTIVGEFPPTTTEEELGLAMTGGREKERVA